MYLIKTLNRNPNHLMNPNFYATFKQNEYRKYFDFLSRNITDSHPYLFNRRQVFNGVILKV